MKGELLYLVVSSDTGEKEGSRGNVDQSTTLTEATFGRGPIGCSVLVRGRSLLSSTAWGGALPVWPSATRSAPRRLPDEGADCAASEDRTRRGSWCGSLPSSESREQRLLEPREQGFKFHLLL